MGVEAGTPSHFLFRESLSAIARQRLLGFLPFFGKIRVGDLKAIRARFGKDLYSLGGRPPIRLREG
jgi:hypothetical protein